MKETFYCSFCGKSQDMVRQLIAGPKVFICNECVELSSSIVNTPGTRIPTYSDAVPTPSEIYEALDSQISGQDRAKGALSAALHRHLLRSQVTPIEDAVLTPSPKVLLCGPSLERSHVARGLFRCLSVPIAAIDVGTLIESGKERDIGQVILGKLLRAAHNNVKSTEGGVIYIDDFDQLGRLSREGPDKLMAIAQQIQKGLVSLIASPTAQVLTDAGTVMTIDPRSIMLICAGTWFDLTALSEGRTPGSSEENEAAKRVSAGPRGPQGIRAAESEALAMSGLLPELVARFSVLAVTEVQDPFVQPSP